MFLVFREFESPTAEIKLEAEETRHIRARRLRPGEEVALGDGAGRRWITVLQNDLRSLRLTDREPETRSEPLRFLYVSPASGKRWDWLVQKATELGVTTICPLICEYTERKDIPDDRSLRIIKEAAVQARRFFLPEVLAPIPFTAIRSKVSGMHSYLLDPSGSENLSGKTPDESPLAIFVGPEGGFSPRELEFAREAGIEIVRLGSAILRTETAALAALACTLA